GADLHQVSRIVPAGTDHGVAQRGVQVPLRDRQHTLGTLIAWSLPGDRTQSEIPDQTVPVFPTFLYSGCRKETSMITDGFLFLGVLLALAAVIVYCEKRSRLAFFRYVPGFVLMYIITALLNTVGVFSQDDEVVDLGA